MVALDHATVEEKLAKLQSIIAKLEEDQSASYEEFEHDFHISDTVMHNMAIGITVIVDIGNHILAEVFQLKTETYADVIVKLADAGVISREFAQQHVGMPKFRNVVMHEYTDVDLEEVYRHFQEAPAIFRQFAKYFEEFLEQQQRDRQ